MLVEVDEDQNGTIEIDEFKKMIDKMLEDSEDLVIEAFKVFDKDQDGKITQEEFMQVMRQLGENVSEEEMLAIYKSADEDGSGEIEIDEFNSIYQNLVAD